METHVRCLSNLPAVLCLLPLLAVVTPCPAKELFVYIGSYTGAKSKGIYLARFNTTSGKLTTPELAAETRNPSFLAAHPRGVFLYSVGEISDFEGKRAGAVNAFKIEPATGKLELINQQPSGGTGPTHLVVDSTGKCVLVANYGSGSIAALPIRADGGLDPAGSVIQHEGSSVNPKRQAGPHAHCINLDPQNRRALVCDLGLDKVLVYQLDPLKATLSANDPPCGTVAPGAGPRHLAFHPKLPFVYVVNEMGSSVTVFSYAAESGALKEVQTISTLPPGFKGESTCAEIQMHPSGRFVYASNRGHDSIAAFQVDRKTGRLEAVEQISSGGKTPRHFAIVPGGKWLLAENQASDSIVVFDVDTKTGRLFPTEEKVEAGSPVCVEFVERH